MRCGGGSAFFNRDSLVKAFRQKGSRVLLTEINTAFRQYPTLMAKENAYGDQGYFLATGRRAQRGGDCRHREVRGGCRRFQCACRRTCRGGGDSPSTRGRDLARHRECASCRGGAQRAGCTWVVEGIRGCGEPLFRSQRTANQPARAGRGPCEYCFV